MTQQTATTQRKFSIFHKMLAAMLLVALVPLLTIWYVNYRGSIAHISASVDQRLSGISDRLVTHVNDWVGMNEKTLRQNAALRDVASMDAARQVPILKTVLNEYGWSYLVFTIRPDGKNIARSDDKELIDYSDRIYFKQVIDGAPLGKQVVLSKTTGKPALILAVPIYGAANNVVTGVMAMGMAIGEISEQVTNSRIGNTGYAFLLDESGKVVAHQKQEYASNAVDFSGHPAFLGRDNETHKQVVFEEDGRKVIAYAQRTQQGWTMVAQQDYDEAFAAISTANRQGLVLLITTLLAAIAIAYLVSQRLAQPIRNLTHIADEISRGKLGATIVEINRGDEIGALAAAIERMSVSIKMALERLKMRA